MPTLDLDAGLGGLLDVAPPLLVHPGQHVVLGAGLPVGGAERDLEDELRLAGGEPALDGLRAPAELVQLRDDAGAGLAALLGRELGRGVDTRRVGDAVLDLGRASTGG